MSEIAPVFRARACRARAFLAARGTSHSFDARNIAVIADGDTLFYNEMINPNPSDPANWRASLSDAGSPGRDDVIPPSVLVDVNALLANPAPARRIRLRFIIQTPLRPT